MTVRTYVRPYTKSQMTSMLWLIDSCQSKVSADQYHVTISRAQVELIEVACFLKLTADQTIGFLLDRGVK